MEKSNKTIRGFLPWAGWGVLGIGSVILIWEIAQTVMVTQPAELLSVLLGSFFLKWGLFPNGLFLLGLILLRTRIRGVFIGILLVVSGVGFAGSLLLVGRMFLGGPSL
jgi:hypothetical protein